MQNFDRILSIAEKNTYFIMLLESAIAKLQTMLNRDIKNYVCLFHTTDTTTTFSLNPSKGIITVFLGEIEYIIEITKISNRLKENEFQNIDIIEKALADEIESVLQKFLLH